MPGRDRNVIQIFSQASRSEPGTVLRYQTGQSFFGRSFRL